MGCLGRSKENMNTDPEALKLAQELCDRGVSNDRISVETGVTKHFIEKWINAGILTVKRDPVGRKLKQKIVQAQSLVDAGMSMAETARKIGVDPSTVMRWRRQGKLKCHVHQ